MARFRKHISFILLFALSVYVMPKELIHEFFHHDTNDAPLTLNSEAAVGNAHVHCDLLQLTSPPFQQPVAAFSFSVSYCCFCYISQHESFHYKDLTAIQYLRGPPLV